MWTRVALTILRRTRCPSIPWVAATFIPEGALSFSSAWPEKRRRGTTTRGRVGTENPVISSAPCVRPSSSSRLLTQ